MQVACIISDSGQCDPDTTHHLYEAEFRLNFSKGPNDLILFVQVGREPFRYDSFFS